MAKAWHYAQNNQTLGPLPETQLKAMLASGDLGVDTLVWSEGMADWQPASRFPDLMPAPAPVSASIPLKIEIETLPEALPSLAIAPAEPSPYAAPRASVGSGYPGTSPSAGSVSAGSLEALRGTKPWVRLHGVMGIIGVGFMVLGALGIGLVGASTRGMGGGISAGMALLYLVAAGILTPPVLYLHRYATRIGGLLESESTLDLEEALEAQKSFWRYTGILMVIYLCLAVLGIIAAIAVPMLLAVRH